MKLRIEVEVEVEEVIEQVDDDDGCGSPSQTGNSMTGRRGSYEACVGYQVVQSDAELGKAVREAVAEVEPG